MSDEVTTLDYVEEMIAKYRAAQELRSLGEPATAEMIELHTDQEIIKYLNWQKYGNRR